LRRRRRFLGHLAVSGRERRQKLLDRLEPILGRFGQALKDDGPQRRWYRPFADLPGNLAGHHFVHHGAARENVNMIIEDMIENGNYQTPEPFMNLALAIQMVQSAYLKARMRNVPEERLELLRRFIEDCQMMLAPPPMAPLAPIVGILESQLVMRWIKPAAMPQRR
jgi:hypothetical protein